MSAKTLLVAPVLAAVLGWQLLGAVAFERGQLGALEPAELVRRARAPLAERLRAELGEHRFAVWRAVMDHVPEPDRVVFVTAEFEVPDSERNAHSLILYTGLLFPRWMLPAVLRPGLDLGAVRPRGDWELWLVDLDSGFGIDWEAHCERVVAGEGFTLWRLRSGSSRTGSPGPSTGTATGTGERDG